MLLIKLLRDTKLLHSYTVMTLNVALIMNYEKNIILIAFRSPTTTNCTARTTTLNLVDTSRTSPSSQTVTNCHYNWYKELTKYYENVSPKINGKLMYATLNVYLSSL